MRKSKPHSRTVPLCSAAGIDTLEEYQENKAKIMAAIDRINAEYKKDDEAIPQKVNKKQLKALLRTLTNPNVSAEDKNIALRQNISHITFVRNEFIEKVIIVLQ